MGLNFPKPIFNATILSYVLGLVMTVLVMNYFHAAQPALLYVFVTFYIPSNHHVWGCFSFFLNIAAIITLFCGPFSLQIRYLVPCTVGVSFLTAALTGQLSALFEYDEEGDNVEDAEKKEN